MKITKAGVDATLTTLAAATGAVMTALVAGGDIDPNIAAAVTGGLAAIVVGYHGGGAVRAATAPNTSSDPAVTQGEGVAPDGSDGDPQLATI